MKTRKLGLLATLMLAGVMTLAVACTDEDDDGDSDSTLSPPGDDTPAVTMTEPPENDEANDRDDFVTTVEAQLEQLQTQIDELEGEIEGMEDDNTAQERLDDLKQRKSDIEARLDEAESASDDEFEALKTEIEQEVENAMTEAQEFADEIGI